MGVVGLQRGLIRPLRRVATRRSGGVFAVAVLVVALVQAPATAATANPYINPSSTPASVGYDVGHPNCAATAPTGDYFAVVGLGGGRPFSTNSCAAGEWSAATGATTLAPSAYFNTGYAGAYAKSVDATCAGASSSAGVYGTARGHQLKQDEEAWAIGCSEVDSAHAFLTTWSSSTPTLWWADVETANSWSTNLALNQLTLDGISSQMTTLGLGGFYSTPSMWASITGSSRWTTTPLASANWVAGGPCTSSFDSGTLSVPTWLVQGSAANGIDTDQAC